MGCSASKKKVVTDCTVESIFKGKLIKNLSMLWNPKEYTVFRNACY